MEEKIIQLDLFAKEKELEKEVEEKEFRTYITGSMRVLFARYNEMEYVLLEMHKRIQKLREATFKNG